MIRNCILTERLVLRPFVDGDEEDVLALMSDDYICRMAGIKPFKTLAEARRFMDNWAGEAYAITERDSDTVIGIIQTPCFWWDRWAGIDYWLAEEYRGHGYMTEAVEARKTVSPVLAGRGVGDLMTVFMGPLFLNDLSCGKKFQ